MLLHTVFGLYVACRSILNYRKGADTLPICI